MEPQVGHQSQQAIEQPHVQQAIVDAPGFRLPIANPWRPVRPAEANPEKRVLLHLIQRVEHVVDVVFVRTCIFGLPRRERVSVFHTLVHALTTQAEDESESNHYRCKKYNASFLLESRQDQRSDCQFGPYSPAGN